MIPMLFALEYTVFEASDAGVRALELLGLAFNIYTCAGQGVLDVPAQAIRLYTTKSNCGELKPVPIHLIGRINARLSVRVYRPRQTT